MWRIWPNKERSSLTLSLAKNLRQLLFESRMDRSEIKRIVNEIQSQKSIMQAGVRLS
jgi:hypothetical protein